MSGLADINKALENEAPVLHRLLSPLGREAYFPPDIPFQAKEAAETRYNGTIGVFTDGHRNALPLSSMTQVVHFEDEADRNKAFLYSPVLGIPEVRRAWADWQRAGQVANPDERPLVADPPTSLPWVVGGLTHGLSLVADFFAGPGRKLVLGKPFWGNYRQVFRLRRGAEMVEAEVYRDGVYDPSGLVDAVAGLPEDEPALVIVNFPSNPGGYSPTDEERRTLRDGLAREAAKRPLLAICDDAYGGLVFGEGVPTRSFFWDLIGAHENLIPVKIDGTTKEFAFFGGRVAFLTFGADLPEGAQKAMDNKAQCLIRATIGSPTANGQMSLLHTFRSGKALEEVEEIRRVARERWDALQPALAELDRDLLRPLPCNAGFFLLMRLAPGLGLDPHDVRRHLIANHDTGIVAAQPDYLRVALCSVDADSLPEMLRRIERGVRELAGR